MSRKARGVELSAAEFMTKHASELAESEEIISHKLLASAFPEGKITLQDLLRPSPAIEAWERARAELPGYQLRRQLKQYWLFRLLEAARKENSPDAYRELLEGWLIQMGVEPPEGVLTSPRRPRGAPRKESTEQIYRKWLTNGRPAWNQLAYDVYGADYTKADARQRKRFRDRCQRAVQRYDAAARRRKSSN